MADVINEAGDFPYNTQEQEECKKRSFEDLRESDILDKQNQTESSIHETGMIKKLRMDTSVHGIRKKLDLLSLAFLLTGLTIDLSLIFTGRYWIQRQLHESVHSTNSTVLVTIGLWEICITFKAADSSVRDVRWCANYFEKFSYGLNFRAAQVFQCLGVLFLGCAVFVTITKLIGFRENNGLNSLAGCHAVWAAVWFAASALAVQIGFEIWNIRQSNTEKSKDYFANIDFIEMKVDSTDYVQSLSPANDAQVENEIYKIKLHTEYVSLGCHLAYLSAFIALIGGFISLFNKRMTSFFDGRRRGIISK